jgi:hypothetical protein
MSMQTVEAPDVVKVATVPLARQRLRREASALRRAAHPDVAQLALFVDLAERTELRLRTAGDRDLVTMPPPDGPTALALGASLASTVADLHAVGVVHGRLTPDHVVIGPTGRPVLCGLSGARDASDAAIAEEVRALATLLEVLATAVPQTGTRRDRRAVATLLAAAEAARATDPVPTASDVAALLGERAGRRVAARSGRVGRRARVGLAMAGVAAVGAAAAWGARRDSSTLPLTPQATPDATIVEVAATTVPSSPPPDTPATSAKPASTSAVEFSSGDARYAVGAEGDVVVTGDWDCDGAIGAALLRPGTGAVYAFDRLAVAGEAVSGRLVAEATTAVGLDVVAQPDGCDVLLLRGADGGAEVLAVAP